MRILVAPEEMPEQVARMLGDSARALRLRPHPARRRDGGHLPLPLRLLPPAAGTLAAWCPAARLRAPSGAGPLQAGGPARLSRRGPLLRGRARAGGAERRRLRPFQLPPLPQPSPEVQHLFAEADTALVAPRPEVRILAPGGKLLAGVQRFEAAGGPGGRGSPTRSRSSAWLSPWTAAVLTRTGPPYVAELDLGQAPRRHRLAVEGMNGRGEVLATDELELNAGAQRFAVRLVEPQPGRHVSPEPAGAGQVEAPADRPSTGSSSISARSGWRRSISPPSRSRSRCRSPEMPATSAPWPTWRTAPRRRTRCCSTHPRRRRRWMSASSSCTRNVVDRAGRPVEGLGAGEVQVFEDGVRQSVRRVERVADTPLRLVTLIDNSASMRPRLEPTRQAALQFLRRTLRPRDQAAVITFNRSPHVAVGLTGDLKALEDGLSGLMADEETSLYDSLIFSLTTSAAPPGSGRSSCSRTARTTPAVRLRGRPRKRPAGRHRGLHHRDRPAQGRAPPTSRQAGRGDRGEELLPARHNGSRPRLPGDRARSALALPDLLPVLEHQRRAMPSGRFGSRWRGQGLEARTISGYYP